MLGLLEVQPRDNSVLLDNATLRGTLIALGYLTPKPQQDEPIKVYDSHITAVETLIESFLLHEHIYLPAIHTADYPPIAEILDRVAGEHVVEAISIDSEQMNAIEQWAVDDITKWPINTQPILRRLCQFAGVEGSVEKWEEWIFAPYQGNAGWERWQIETRNVVSAHLTRLFLGQSELSDSFLEISEKFGLGIDNYSLSDLTDFEREKRGTQWRDRAVLWLTYRTCIYDCISWILGIPYVPHPQRASLWEAINLHRSDPRAFYEMPLDALREARRAVGTDVNKAAGVNVFDIDIPPYFTFVLTQASSPEEVIPFTMKLRNRPDIVELRRKLWGISQAIHEMGGTLKLQRLNVEFEQLSKGLCAEFLATERPSISPSIQIAGVIGVEIDTVIPEGLHRLLMNLKVRGKPHLAFLRDVFTTTVDVWSLSQLYDKIFWRNRKYVPKSDITIPSAGRSYSSEGWSREPQERRIKFVSVFECREKLRAFLHTSHAKGALLALVDCDDLDGINEKLGRKTGDRILAMIAMAISKSLDHFEQDTEPYVARTGDTFIVVVLNVSAVKIKTEMWRRLLDKEVAKWREQFDLLTRHTPDLSISVGHAVSQPTKKDSINDLFITAYTRLQTQKSNKKNKSLRKKS